MSNSKQKQLRFLFEVHTHIDSYPGTYSDEIFTMDVSKEVCSGDQLFTIDASREKGVR